MGDMVQQGKDFDLSGMSLELRVESLRPPPPKVGKVRIDKDLSQDFGIPGAEEARAYAKFAKETMRSSRVGVPAAVGLL